MSYAATDSMLVLALAGALLVVAIVLVAVWVMHLQMRLHLRSTRQRAARLAAEVAAKATDIGMLEMRLARAKSATPESGVPELQAEMRRLAAIRKKTEDRLVAQNAEVEALRLRVSEQDEELAILRELLQHAGGLDTRAANDFRSAA